MKLWTLILFVVPISCENPAKYPENPADISSINNLASKPAAVSLDPRIRKALLNVLNRLELQDNQQPETELVPLNASNVNQPVANVSTDDIKWEYKANDTFKEYNYYEAINSDDKKSDPQPIEDKNEEPGALFFQIPDQQDTFEKHESLNLQETKNAIASTSELLIGDLPEANEKPKPADELLAAVTAAAPSSNGVAAGTSSTFPQTKNEITEKDVEVFQAPLLTAFTLEHDERGLPRRIIPLEASELRSILDNRVTSDLQLHQQQQQQQQHDVRRAREPVGPVFRAPASGAIPLLQEEKRIRFELESQLQELQERKRQIEFEKERLFAEQEKARRFKYALEQRQKEQEYLRALKQNEIVRSEIALQKSVEHALPPVGGLFERPSVVLQPLFQLPSKPAQPQYITDSVDRQLQHLFHRSGLGRQEDLNIVSKILALNHEGDDEERPKQRQQQQQQATNQEQRSGNAGLVNRRLQRLALPGENKRFTMFT